MAIIIFAYGINGAAKSDKNNSDRSPKNKAPVKPFDTSHLTFGSFPLQCLLQKKKAGKKIFAEGRVLRERKHGCLHPLNKGSPPPPGFGRRGWKLGVFLQLAAPRKKNDDGHALIMHLCKIPQLANITKQKQAIKCRESMSQSQCLILANERWWNFVQYNLYFFYKYCLSMFVAEELVSQPWARIKKYW